MKRIRILAAALALCLLFGGCAGDEGEYHTSRPHSERAGLETAVLAGGDITNYYSLKGALLNMVNIGLNADVFRISSYNGDLEEDLKAVIQEITTEEPMGIYGVSSINADRTRVLSYQDVSVQIQYKRSPAEMQAVVALSGRYDLENRLLALLRTFSPVGAFAVTDGLVEDLDLDRMLYTAWMRCGPRAVSLSQTSVAFYPENSDNCIVEVAADYGEDQEALRIGATAILRSAAAVAGECTATETLEKLSYVNSWLLENVEYDESAQRVVNETQAHQPKTDIYTAVGVFNRRIGAQSGFVLAASVLCDALDIEHTVRTGTLGEDVYSWITLTSDGVTYVYDPTGMQNGRELWLYTAAAANELFVEW